MVVGSAIAAVLIAINLLSFRHRSTNLASIISVVLLLAAVMVTNVTVGLRYESHPGMLRSPPVLIALGLVVMAFLSAVVSLVQFGAYHRYRRGRKRAVAVMVLAVGAMAFYAYQVYDAKHPKPVVIVTEEPPPRDFFATTPKPIRPSTPRSE